MECLKGPSRGYRSMTDEPSPVPVDFPPQEWSGKEKVY